MKNIGLGFKILALLGLAGGITAPSFGHAIHVDLVFKTIATTYTYDGDIVATWDVHARAAANANELGRVSYTVTITGLKKDKNYSLLTLGLQSCEVPVVVAPAANAKFGSAPSVEAGTPLAGFQTPTVIYPVGMFIKDPANPDKAALDEDAVWFVTPVDDTQPVVITVEPAGRRDVGMTSWANQIRTGYSSSHDTIPARGTPAK